MREKLHKILDLVLDLNEQGATRSNVDFSGYVENVSVMVWEGECTDENMLLHDYTYYGGKLRNEKKLNDIIRELEEVKENI